MTSIFLQLRKSQNVLNFCSHLFENQLRYIYIYNNNNNNIMREIGYSVIYSLL